MLVSLEKSQTEFLVIMPEESLQKLQDKSQEGFPEEFQEQNLKESIEKPLEELLRDFV